jgi:hypothetical protein
MKNIPGNLPRLGKLLKSICPRSRFRIRFVDGFPLCLLCLSLLLSGFAPLPAPSALTKVIYTDELASGWDVWPWAQQVDLNATTPTHSGSKSMAVTFTAWQGFTLHQAEINTGGLADFRFFIHGGASGGQQLWVYLSLSINGETQNGPSISLSPPAGNAWSEIRLSLAALNPDEALVTGINFQSANGSSQPTFYLDDLSLESNQDPDAPEFGEVSLLPRAVYADGVSQAVVKVSQSDPQGMQDILSVNLDASPIGGGSIPLLDDGLHNDGQAGDGVYGTVFSVAPGTPPGEVSLLLNAADRAGRRSETPLGALVVLNTPGGDTPVGLPAHIGWGSSAWSETPGQDWQVKSGVPWDYVCQYITYEWYADGNGNGWGGDFVGRFVRQGWDKDFTPVVVVYMMLGLPPTCGESPTCYAQKLQDAGAVRTYLAAIQEAARQAIGDKPVIFNIEPDFYGYMQQLSNSDSRPAGVQPDDPASYPVALNITGYANNLAGFGRRLVDLIHATAPNALVAPMASMWATNNGPQNVTAAEAASMGQRTAAFIDAMGGDRVDLLVVEWSDRDALAVGRPLWDPQDLELPRHTRAILWENALATAAGKRLLLWQVPVGNMSQDNTCNHYQDNHSAYAFSHPRDLFDAGVIGVLFGGGATCMTSVETDGGFVANQGGITYAAPAAPSGLKAVAQEGAKVTLHWDESGEPDLWGYRLTYRRMPSAATFTLDAHRQNTLEMVLPVAGTWSIQISAYDAMGIESALSPGISIVTSSNAEQIFLPLVSG